MWWTCISVALHKLAGEARVPQEWKDALMTVLYKGKGAKDDCSNSRGIALFFTAGKLLCKMILHCLQYYVTNEVLSEPQFGFRGGRCTVDMIFSAWQLQEKFIEHLMDLFQVFIELAKAFNTVNRKPLWLILEKLGCPNNLFKILRLFHDDMQTWINVGCKLPELISVVNGVEQGDIPVPTSFSFYFAVFFQLA